MGSFSELGGGEWTALQAVGNFPADFSVSLSKKNQYRSDSVTKVTFPGRRSHEKIILVFLFEYQIAIAAPAFSYFLASFL